MVQKTLWETCSKIWWKAKSNVFDFKRPSGELRLWSTQFHRAVRWKHYIKYLWTDLKRPVRATQCVCVFFFFCFYQETERKSCFLLLFLGHIFCNSSHLLLSENLFLVWSHLSSSRLTKIRVSGSKDRKGRKPFFYYKLCGLDV